MGSKRKIVVGISGATGTIYAIRLLRALRNMEIESHLVVSTASWEVARIEYDPTINFAELADFYYENSCISAPIASGSFVNSGMVVIPCSMKTLSGIAHSYGNTLIGRAADVTLKDRRPLVLVARETPLHLGHLRNMVAVAEMGGIIFPPMPAFYNNPVVIDDLVDHFVGRILDLLGFENDIVKRWKGAEFLDRVIHGG